MNHLQKAVDINNATARQVALGVASNDPNRGPIAAWQRALTSLQSFHEHCAAIDPCSNGTAMSPLNLVESTTMVTTAAGQAIDKLSFCFGRSDGARDENNVGVQSGAVFVYTRPLMLLPRLVEMAAHTCHQEAVGLVASTTCLFNLALAWHDKSLCRAASIHRNIAGPGGQDAHSIAANKAQKLYQMILAILNHPDCVHDSHRDETHVVLKCLVLNNLAHLLYAQGDYASFQGIVNVQRMILASVATECLQDHLGTSMVRELMLNALHVALPDVALAA